MQSSLPVFWIVILGLVVVAAAVMAAFLFSKDK